VPGSVLLGRPGDEYRCTHDHCEGGDECLAVHLTPQLVHEIAPRHGGGWRSGSAPPLAELIVRGERLRAAAAGHCDIGLDEAALSLVACYASLADPAAASKPAARAIDRRRAVESALWIDAHADQQIDLHALAARSGLSAFSICACSLRRWV
jgi:hypothetical protein